MATPSRLRAALAALALERAFGNQIKAGLAGKLGLSAKAGRLLAAQLAKKPRDFGTDARLIAALAAEHVARPDRSRHAAPGRAAALPRRAGQAGARGRVRRRKPASRGRAWSRRRRRRRRGRAAGSRWFRPEVRRHAASHAQGWIGNRKAYISHVWQLMPRQASRLGPLGDRVQVHACRGASRRPASRSPMPT